MESSPTFAIRYPPAVALPHGQRRGAAYLLYIFFPLLELISRASALH
jgi:hypothetical protein